MRFCDEAIKVIDIEQHAISTLKHQLGEPFEKTCQLIQACTGKVIVLAIGKSGHIGNKISATFASTGTPAFSVHAAEASHGDMGMITKQDVVLAISFSGSTPEVISLLPLVKRLGVPLIAMTGNVDSPLAKAAEVHLHIDIDKEACPLNLAPTASTTATLVLGDAIAIALLTARGFTEEDFAFAHPGGALGKKLLLRVADVMHTENAIPCVSPTSNLEQTIVEMTSKRLGMTTVIDQDRKLLGVFTDGDIRRAFANQQDWSTTPIEALMSTGVKTIAATALAAKALNLMEKHKITALVVTDTQQRVVGVVHIHQLLEAGIA